MRPSGQFQASLFYQKILQTQKAQNAYKRTKQKMQHFYVLKKHLCKRKSFIRLFAFCTFYAFCAFCACKIFL